MMIDLCNKLVDNDLAREDLLERVEIRKTSVEDLEQICKVLAKSFNLSSHLEALFQLENSKARLDESVKLVDKETGDIYGLLIFTEYPIDRGSPIRMVESGISEYLSDYKQVNGHSFIIDERLRNCGIDKKMLYFNADFLMKNYDFIWIGVEESLRSKSYWERLGFTKVFEIPEATFYLMPLSKKMINEYL
jgi:ribosomal protein S18 acetylase RimI-like enzyme